MMKVESMPMKPVIGKAARFFAAASATAGMS
jgi:hypothetical protein